MGSVRALTEAVPCKLCVLPEDRLLRGVLLPKKLSS